MVPRGALPSSSRLLSSLLLLSISTRCAAFSPVGRQSSRANTSIRTSSSTSLDALPQLVVFDLDNTIWTPELFQLRKLQRQNVLPKAGLDVDLFPGTKKVMESIRTDKAKWSNTRFAVASRTKSVDWAHHLLDEFGIRDLFHHVEIFPGNKDKHFANLRDASGVPYDKMIFFDDTRDGRYGNCEPVGRMGVLSVHTPGGLYCDSIFNNAIEAFEKKWDGKPAIVEHDGAVTTLPKDDDSDVNSNKRLTGKVAKFFDDRGFGFIRYGNRNNKDLFFHVRNLNGDEVSVGDEVSFLVRKDKRTGKKEATQVEDFRGGGAPPSNSASDVDTVNMRVFSMNQPFAALLANGFKTLETRNGTMFMPYTEGTKFLLHVGRRTYPDGNKHIDVMKSGGQSDADIEELKSLPNGFGKGMAVAILEIGKTYDTTLEERSDPDFQRKVCAFGADSGRRATEVRRVEYLKKPVRVSGQGGVFKADVPRDVIPDGWLGEEKEGVSGGRVVYSISG